MEQNNDQLEDATIIEQTEETAGGEDTIEDTNDVTMSVTGNSPNAQGAEQKAVVTDTKATIKIEGQEFELEAELAQDDKLLKTILQPHFASIENANISRDVKEGKLTVSIVKRAQHKGASTSF